MITEAALVAIGGCACWAGVQVISKIALRDTSMFVFASVEFFLMLILVTIYGLLTGQLVYSGERLTVVSMVGGFADSFAGIMLYLMAIKRIDAHKAAPLANIAPFWGLITAIFFLDETARPILFISAILIVLGSYFLTSSKKERYLITWDLGVLFALAAGLLWGVAETVPTKYCLSKGMNPTTYQFVLVTISSVAWGLTALIVRTRRNLKYTSRGVAIGILCGIFTLLGWILWLTALNAVKASQLAPFRGSLVLFAFLFSILLLREKISIRSLLGITMIIGGLILALG